MSSIPLGIVASSAGGSVPIEFLGYAASNPNDGAATFPALLENDLVVLSWSADNSSNFDNLVNSQGYTTLADISDDSAYMISAYKVMGSIPDNEFPEEEDTKGSALFTFWRNVDTSSPIASTVFYAVNESGMPNPVDHPNASAGNLVLALGSLDDDELNFSDVTPPTGFTLAGVSGFNSTAMVAYKLVESDGSVAIDQFTSSIGSDAWIAASIELQVA